MRVALRLALQGNLAALRIVLDRVCGRVPDATTDGAALDIDLPNLSNVANCTTAIDTIAAAITAGTIDHAAAKLLVDVIGLRMKSIEMNDLEARLAELEKAAANVDLDGRNRRRL